MGNDKTKIITTGQGEVDLWQNLSISQFEESAKTLLKHVESVQQQFTAIRANIASILRQGTILALTESDDLMKLEKGCDRVRLGVLPCMQEIESVRKAIAHWRDVEHGSRRARFEATLKRRGWTLIGNWPEPVVSGTVFVVVDDAKERATVNGESVGGQPTAEKIIAQVERELRELDKNRAEPEKFINDLWNAYKRSGGRINEGVMVYDLLRELLFLRQNKNFFRNPTSTQFRPYPVAQFRADLTNYLAAGAPSVRDSSGEYCLDIVGGSYAEQGVFMYFPQVDRLATCGRLTFRPAKT